MARSNWRLVFPAHYHLSGIFRGGSQQAIVQKRAKSGRYRFVKGGAGYVRAVSTSFFIGHKGKSECVDEWMRR